MRFDSVIELATSTIVEDDLLNRKSEFAKRLVYANAFSISRREIEVAGQDKIKPDYAYQINSVDYQNETNVFVNNKQYYIYRVTEHGDRTVLFLTERIPDGN